MTVFLVHQMMKLIVLAVCFLQSAKCVRINDLLLKNKNGNTFTPMSTKRSFTEGDIELYFNTVRPFRQPTPGSYKNRKLSVQPWDALLINSFSCFLIIELDLAMRKTKNENQGSSEKILVDPYWPTLNAQILWEDFDSMTKDLQDLKKSIEKRSIENAIIKQDGTVIKPKGHSKNILREHANGLELIHNSLKQHMSYKIEQWAYENHFPDPKIFSSQNFLKEIGSSSDSSSKKEKMIMGPENVVRHFPKDRLEELSEKLENEGKSYANDKDQDFMTLRRIHIQTLDQVYKFGLIDDEDLKNLAVRWFNSRFLPTIHNMFQFFYPFREVDENKGFQSLKFALKSYYQSPFLNILKVLGDLSNRRFAESLIVYQSLKFKADIRDPFENVVKKAVDCLCQNNGLLKALEEAEEYQLDKSGRY
ncbi:hypothetical protein PGTUg99_035130 [Puccinia graminis f. sp. tritici]|uniref:Uncharacterized protein n=1 Tax=Puccinia graminis f. sp. tritici TaxID=56615 RepID=A0A5B0PQC1_PUCGR|nr:hypothetical protein PGTUg99_035130 [Puccinia graminis f. sp. tritici]